MRTFNLTDEPTLIVPPKPRRPYGPHNIGLEQQRFTVDQIDYRLVIPPHTGCRSAFHFFIHKGIIPFPDEYIKQYKAELYPGFYFSPLHLEIEPEDFERKIIITVRHPFRVIMSAAKMDAATISKREDTISPTPDQLRRAIDHNIQSNHAKPYIKHWLKGRKPDYFLKGEDQEAEMSKLPFIKDTEGYIIHNDEKTYDSDHYKHHGIVNRLKLTPFQKDVMLDYLVNNYKDQIYKLFEEDMKEFGYADI